MKKFFISLILICAVISSCNKIEIGNGAKLRGFYQETYDGQIPVEIWKWDRNTLNAIEYYKYGELEFKEIFTYNKDGNIAHVDLIYVEGLIHTSPFDTRYKYEYSDNGQLSKIKHYDIGDFLLGEYTFKYTDNKISEIGYVSALRNRSNDMLKYSFNPIKRIVTEDFIKELDKTSNNRSNYEWILSIEWNGDNISKVETPFMGSESTLTQEYSYDDKLNPFYHVFNRDVISSYQSDILPASKNNIVKITSTYKNFEEFNYITKYEYEYEDDFPIKRTYSYILYPNYTVTDIHHYEYE